MKRFDYARAPSPAHALDAARSGSGTRFLAGGTTLVDLMKLGVEKPARLIDINGLSGMDGIVADGRGLHLGAMVRMAEAEADPAVRRDYPVIAQSLTLAASAQLRNMASLGGNVLQRTRCSYFRDTAFACNKRIPNSGCAALDGVNRSHAILGVSDRCIAAYPGDFAQALVALDAQVILAGTTGQRRIAMTALHREPGDTPHVETNLRDGEMIVGFFIPASARTRRSVYMKVRDRQSYAFALASAAVAVELDGDNRVTGTGIALGGLASRPWRAEAAERALIGATLDEAVAARAAEAAFAGAHTAEGNRFKVALGKQTLVRALMAARALEG